MSADDLADAIRFRASFGLRADEWWIQAVAADPASAAGEEAYGVPLTLAEVAELDRRAKNADEIRDVIESYGHGHPRDWAGIFIDHQAGGVVVALFSGHLAEHEAAIRQRVSPLADFELRPARWSLEQLEAFKARIEADQDWLRTIDAWYWRSQVYPIENLVELRISSANPSAPVLVLQHYGADGWLKVLSDGIGRWEGPLGTLVVRAVSMSGVPDRHLACLPIPDQPAAYTAEWFWQTNDNGECRIPNVGATGYEVRLLRNVGSEWVVVGRGRVTVPPNGEGRLDVVVEHSLGT